VYRTGAVVDSVTFPKPVILSVPPQVANYGQSIAQSNASPVLHKFKVSDATADGRVWAWWAQYLAGGGGYNQFLGLLLNDTENASTTWLRVDRTGMTVDQVELIATTIKLTGAFSLGTPLGVASGGSGVATLADHGVMLGSGTGAVTVTGAGSAGEVLTSNGASADPTFQAIPGAAAAFTDRGDASAPDHTQATLTIDSAWHDWDLSGIVPAGATSVLIRALVSNATAASAIWLRKNGQSNTVNSATLRATAPAQTVVADLVVACDANRVIEYYVGNLGTYDDIDLTVAGWWK